MHLTVLHCTALHYTVLYCTALQCTDPLASEGAVCEVDVPGAAGEVTEDGAEAGEAPVLHEVEAEVEGGQVAVLVGAHGARQLLEELPPHPRAGQVDLLQTESSNKQTSKQTNKTNKINK